MLIHAPPRAGGLDSRLSGGFQQATGLPPANFYTKVHGGGKSAGGPSQGEVGFIERKENEGRTFIRVWFHESE